jgi:hypothetical protein
VRLTLFDQNAPRALGLLLPACDVRTAAAQGWGELENGDLLKAAEAAGFSLMITCDQNIQYQQNIGARRIALAVLSTNHWVTLRRNALRIAESIDQLDQAGYVFIDCGLPTLVRRPPPGSRL